MSINQPKRALDILRHYQQAAIDFSRRNRLLKYPARATKIEFDVPLEECESRFGILDDVNWTFNHKQILKEEEEARTTLFFDIDPSEDLMLAKRNSIKTSVKGKKLISTLEKLRLGSKKSFQEHGLHTLFMVFGEVCWKEHTEGRASGDASKENDFVAPLLLIPITLEVEKSPSKATVLSVDTNLHPIQINPVLMLFIKQNFDLRLPNIPNSADGMQNFCYRDLREILKDFENVFDEKGIAINTTEKIYLGQFSFHGQQIYEDLCKNEVELLQNEFVNTICGGESIYQDNSRLVQVDSEDFNPDTFLTKEEDFTILDADGSQIQAIKKIMSGKHMVIHGPPGTGKSQTIANVISNFLARNKKVLFVCEKQVALEVVYKRLSSEHTNVADLCLPLFNYTNNKKTFAADLLSSRRDAMESVKNSRAVDVETILQSRQLKIELLKSYGEVITRKVAPLDRSLYWIFGELAKVGEQEKDIIISWKGTAPLDCDFGKYERGKSVVDDINGLMDLLDEQSQWNSVHRKHFSLNFSQRVIEILKEVDSSLGLMGDLFDCSLFVDLAGIKSLCDLVSIKDPSIIFEDYNKIIALDHNYLENVKHSIVDIRKQIQLFSEVYNQDANFSFPEDWKTVEQLDIVALDSYASLQDIFSSKINSTIEDLVKLSAEIDKGLPEEILNLGISDFQEKVGLFNIDIYITPLIELSRSNLYDVRSAIGRLEELTSRLHGTDELISRYGIDYHSIDSKIIYILEGSFTEKYKTIFRIFSRAYKKDKREIFSWCGMRKPEKHAEFDAIVGCIALRTKTQRLIDQEWDKFLTSYSLKENARRLALSKIMISVNVILTYLEMNNLEYTEHSVQKYVQDLEVQSVIVKKATVVDQILSGWKSLTIVTGGVPFAGTLSEIEYSVKRLSVDAKKTKEMFDLVSIYVDPKQLPKNLDELNVDVAALNYLKDVIDAVKNSEINEYLETTALAILTEKETIDRFESYISAIENYLTYLVPEFTRQNPASLKVLLGKVFNNCKEISVSYLRMVSSFDGLSGLFENDETMDAFLSVCYTTASDKTKLMINDPRGLERWTEYQQCKNSLEEMNLGWFIRDIARLSLPVSTNLKDVYTWSFFNKWIEDYSVLYPIVRGFNRHKYVQIIRDFKVLEKESLDINRLRILNGYLPYLKESDQSCEAERKLRNEALKKMRHLPIRTLIQRYAEHIQLMKPCWMVSPLALSSYLEFGKVDFDVVIFDEASQMKIENSLGAIARSKQVVVIGDEHQLPPSSFFSAALDGDGDENEDIDEELGFESILQKAISMLGSSEAYLKYHYRSCSEDLIAFSNHHIYKNRLITFPNQNDTKGVVFRYVKGIYDRGVTRTNFIEAEAVAMECIEHIINQPDKSLGVIAFSRVQEQCIRDAVNEKLKDYEHLTDHLDESSDKKEGFFIKNLESVQGDERDVIILSICYGPDKLGAPPSSFGPIGNDSGYRRLNVAITRAKDRLICVSSIRYNEMRPSNNRGVLLLQKYLEYAEKGWQILEGNLLDTAGPLLDHDSDFEACVEEALVKNGYKVGRQVGVSGFKIDLAIVSPKNSAEYILGIECDGAAFHSSKSARIRDRMRQDILESRGWKIYRIWSQHWYTNQQEVIEDIIRHVNSLSG